MLKAAGRTKADMSTHSHRANTIWRFSLRHNCNFTNEYCVSINELINRNKNT